MNNKDLEQAIHEINRLSFEAAKAKHIADGWPNSSYGDDARKQYESARKRAQEIYQRWRNVAKLAERYGDLPSELLFQLYAYDATEARFNDLKERRVEMLKLGITESQEPIRKLDEELLKAQAFMRELFPKTNKCLKLVEYVGLEWYDAVVKHLGATWMGRKTIMRLIPRELVHGGQYREVQPTHDYAAINSPFAVMPTKTVNHEFTSYAFGLTQDSIQTYRLCLVEAKNEVLVMDYKLHGY